MFTQAGLEIQPRFFGCGLDLDWYNVRVMKGSQAYQLQSFDGNNCCCATRLGEPVWYEQEIWQYGIAYACLAVFGVLTWPTPSLWVSFVSVAMHLGSWVFDYKSTMSMENFRPEYEKRNLEYPCREANMLLPDEVTWLLLLVSWPTLISLIAIPIVYDFPAIGLAFGVSRFLVGLSNARKARLMRRALHQHDLCQPAP